MYKNKEWYNHRNQLMAKDYKSLTMTTEQIAKKYNIVPRNVQRAMKALGVIRTQSEANKAMAKLKNYEGHKNPNKVTRLTLPKSLRYKIIKNHPFCTVCGGTPSQCPLQVDHIDGNPRNNNENNLQVLCMDCNYGKK